MTEASETLIATLIHMAECKDMGRGPAPDCPLRKAVSEITRLQAEVDRLREALTRAESDFHLIALDSGIRLTLQQNAKLARNNCRAALSPGGQTPWS